MNHSLDELLSTATKKESENICIVRVKTSMWSDAKGAYIKKNIMFLRRQCKGFNVLEEDISAAGAQDVLPRILNLSECDDGIYRLITCNESRDWETGYIDDYDYKLVKVQKELMP